MTNGKIILLAVCLQLSVLSAIESDFIQKHLVDEQLAAILDEHSDELSLLVRRVHATTMKKHGVWTFDWLPGYYVKYNVERVRKRNILAESIARHKLHLLDTPKKRLYHIKGRPRKFTNLNYVVVIKAVTPRDSQDKRPLDLETVKQVVRLIEDTGHISVYNGNYIIRDGGGISFIDTDGTFSKERSYVGVIRLLAPHNLTTYYTEDALNYLYSRVEAIMATLTGPKKREATLVLKDMIGSDKLKSR